MTANQCVHSCFLVVHRLHREYVRVTALTLPATALTLLVANVSVLVVVPTVLAAASPVLESTERVVVEVAKSR